MGHQWRVTSYKKAANIIRAIPHEVTDVIQLAGIRGIDVKRKQGKLSGVAEKV
jgi:hypothetical protein